MTSTILQFSADNLPVHFFWQMRDFARMEWYGDVPRELGPNLHPEHWHPTYLVIADGQILISSAAVLWTTINYENQAYKIYGLGMVLTYPSYRKRGYGRQIVAAANDYIRQDAGADMALLQTAPHLEAFYGAHGWEHCSTMRVLSGDPDNPVADDGWFMVQFLSDRAQQQRANFETTPFYLDTRIW